MCKTFYEFKTVKIERCLQLSPYNDKYEIRLQEKIEPNNIIDIITYNDEEFKSIICSDLYNELVDYNP